MRNLSHVEAIGKVSSHAHSNGGTSHAGEDNGHVETMQELTQEKKEIRPCSSGNHSLADERYSSRREAYQGRNLRRS